MFKRIYLAKSIYEGVVEPSYKKSTRKYANHAGLSRKMRGESASPTTCYNMSDSADEHRKRYADHTKDKSKLTCLIHGPGN